MLGVVRLNSVRRLLLSCIQFVTFHTIFEKDSDLTHTPMMERIRWLLYHKKSGNIFKILFVLKMGGGPKGPRKRAALAPHFSEQKRFQNISPFFCERTNIPYLSLLKPRAKSESLWKIVWNITNWIRERSHRRTELSRTTPSIP